MRIQLKKGSDGPSTLACVRTDGTTTWGKEHPFFPTHDLTHCAVESVLGFNQAFFGLIASGWNIDDFVQPGASRRLPLQAIVAEHVVGVLDRERLLAQPLSVVEFNENVRTSLPEEKRSSFAFLSELQLKQVRALREALEAHWRRLPVGNTLQVEFPVKGAPQ